MPNQFSPDADDHSSEKKRSQQRLLLLLLLLIGLFVYLYFFTGLIRPRPETAQAPPPPSAGEPAAEVVKQPLPPRPEGEAAAPGAAVPGATEPAKPAPAQAAAPVAKPSAGGAPAAKPAPSGQPAPAAQAKTAKPAAAAVAAKEKIAKPATPAKEAKPATAAKDAKPATAAKAKPAAATKEAKPAATAKSKPAATAKSKPATAAKEGKPAAAAAKPAPKPAAEAKAAKGAAPKTAKATAKPAAGVYALEINGDLAESEMGPVTAKLKKAGISNVVTSKAQKGEPMHRLFLADFGDRGEAAEELERLKMVAPSAFMLKENNRYAVYAGSFLREGKAAVEQDRLYDKGVRLMLKEATTPVSVVRVRAGSFADQASAQKAAGNLKKSGLTAKVVKVGK